jgi:hypothetical protein
MKDILEEVAENYVDSFEYGIAHPRRVCKNAFINGTKWQQERSYSEKEVYDLMDKREHYWVRYKNYYAQSYIPFDEWFEQNKKK